MSAYSPFSRDISELTAEDLVALRDTSEGWYIEYKREVPNASSIAKSVSAFANTYGGWVFYGIVEKSKENPVAEAFPGIAETEIDGALQRIRQAVATQVVPAPHFDHKVIYGPSTNISLADGYAVICLWCGSSISAPHVHKNGQIYRRVADGSEPKPENDRFILDQLWRRGDEMRKAYKKWVRRDPEFSKGEQEIPFIRILIDADPLYERGAWLPVSIQQVREIMNSEQRDFGPLPFDTIYTSSNGFVCRQARGNDPHNLSLTWKLNRHLHSDVIIPLSFYRANNVRDALLPLRPGYHFTARFQSILEEAGFQNTRVVDLNFIFNIFAGIVETQTRLAEAASWSHPFQVKLRLLNAWRTIPFVDVDGVLKGLEHSGVPVCMDETVTAPVGYGPDDFREMPTLDHIENRAARILVQASIMFELLATAYGIPSWDAMETGDLTSYHFEDLIEAGKRATDNQRVRLARK